MYKVLLALCGAFLFFVGCSDFNVVPSDSIPGYNTAFNIHDPVFNEYLNRASDELGDKFQILVRFAEPSEGMTNNTAGVCMMGTGVIIINPNLYKRYTRIRKYALILHELGHCVYGLNHTSTDDDAGCREGLNIMHNFINCSVKEMITNKDYIDRMADAPRLYIFGMDSN